jgi:hypothetical protein
MATSTTTTSTTPAATIVSVTESWIKTHERILIVALVLAVGAFGLNKYFDYSAAKSDARAVAAETVAADAKANAAKEAVTAAQTQAQYTALVQALAAQNASLAASIATRNTGLQQTQAKTGQMTPTELTATWQSLLPGKLAGKITQSSVKEPDGTNTQVFTVDLGPAVETVNALEEIPVLQANLADETKVAQNYLQEVQKSDVLANDLSTQVTGLQTQIVANDNSCKAQIVAVKADARKGKIKAFKWGFITGFVSGLFAGHNGL